MVGLFNWHKNAYIKTKGSDRQRDVLHNGFEIGVILKGINGLLETIGGLLLIFVNPVRFNKIILFLVQEELSEDPNDIIAKFILKASQGFSVSSQFFSIFYLISHGIIKLVLVILLRKRKLWAYPLTIAFLDVFVLIQLIRFTYNHSTALMALTVFDTLIIILTGIEYRRIKRAGVQ